MDNMIKKAYDSVKLSDRSRQRVLGALLAEEGKETRITMTKTEKKKDKKLVKRSAGMIAAVCAAAVMTVSVGAYAYTQFVHKQNVETYLGRETADKLESAGLVLNEVKENEHYRITADTILSDGQSAELVFTFDKLDQEARELLSNTPYPVFYYADTDEECPQGSSWTYLMDGEFGSVNWLTMDTFSLMIVVPANGIDLSRGITLRFYDDFIKTTLDEEHLAMSEPNCLEGLDFDLDLSKNVDTAVLTAEDGTEMLMSQFGVTAHETLRTGELSWDGVNYRINTEDIFLIRADGTRERLEKGPWHVINGDDDYRNDGANELFGIYHQQFIDIDDYLGVEIHGIEYLKR